MSSSYINVLKSWQIFRGRLAARPPTAEWLVVSVVIAFGGGILGNEIIPWPELWRWAIILWSAGVILFFHFRKQAWAATVCLPFFFFFIGLLYGGQIAPPSDSRHIYNQIDKRREATISGILTECPITGPDKTTFRVKVDNILEPSGINHASEGLVQLSLSGNIPEGLKPGDRLMARASLARVRNYGTPGAFDYKSFLAARSIWITGWVKSPALIMPVHEAVAAGRLKSLRYWPERVRYRINTFLDNTIDRHVAGLYKSILTGDRSGLSAASMENFKAAGVFHLLAISGLHIGLLCVMSTIVIGWLLKRSTWILLNTPVWKIAALLSLLPITFYALIAGFQTPVVRALIMAAVFILAFLADRQWSLPVNIGIAALVIMALQPAVIYSASFQLSFAAVIAIAFIYPELAKYLKLDRKNNKQSRLVGMGTYLKKWGFVSLAISVAAMLGTAPLLLMHFNRFSILSPISTLLVEPLLCLWGLFFGLAACLFINLAPSLAGFFFQVGSWGLSFANHLVSGLAAFPFNSIWLPTPSWAEVCLYYILLVTVFSRHKNKMFHFIAILAFSLLVGLPFYHFLERSGRVSSNITILDVGQGASTLLELPHGKSILIDGGGPESPRFNVGRQLIAPFLWHQGLFGLDALVITHPHADHYNGLFFVIKHFRPKTLWINGEINAPPEYDALIRTAAACGAVIREPGPAQNIFDDGRARVMNVGWRPAREKGLAPARNNHNNMSLVLRLDHGKKSFLFPGDIEADAETLLLAGKQQNLDTDVLLAPHHGSSTSSSRDFIKEISPSYIVISSGSNFSGRYPAPEVMERYKLTGARIFSTNRQGSIFFQTDGEHLSVHSVYE